MSDRIGRYYRVWEVKESGAQHIGNVYSTSAWKVGNAIQTLLREDTGHDFHMLTIFKLYRIDRVPCDE